MQILANENVTAEIVAALRSRGHDVAWVRSDAPGSSDREVLERAQAEERLVLTFDKDFGELAFRFGLPATAGVVLFRLAAPSPERLAEKVTTVLESRADWPGHFAVVERDRIRLRPLPSSLDATRAPVLAPNR